MFLVWSEFLKHCYSSSCKHMPRVNMSNYKNKHPVKTSLVSYLVSKSHGSEACNCWPRDQWVLVFGTMIAALLLTDCSSSLKTKNNSGTQNI